MRGGRFSPLNTPGIENRGLSAACVIEVIFQGEPAIYYKDFEQFLIKSNKLPIVIYFLRNCERVSSALYLARSSQTRQINGDNYSFEMPLQRVIILIYLLTIAGL